MKPSTSIFQFLRGAIRGAYGQEDLREKRILIVGQEEVGRELLKYLCFDNVYVFISKAGLEEYVTAFHTCQGVELYDGQEMDLVIDTIDGVFTMRQHSFPLSSIKIDAYNQGLSEYYLK